MIDLNKVNKIYFVGIGGIGISAVAGIMHARSFLVEGSDAVETEIVNDLREHQITIHVPHRAENIHNDIDLICYSVAVPENNPELIKANELKIPLVTYPQLLGMLIQNKYGIGVSGTDGKTTTTAMLSKILIDGGLDPTVVLGSKADFLEDNWRIGDSKYFAFEADEYRRAFDNYLPKLAVITNVGLDHLDYFKDQVDYLKAFKDYVKKIPKDGAVVINNDNENSIAVGLKTSAKIITFALNAQADYRAEIKEIKSGRQIFQVWEKGIDAGEFKLRLPGDYNVYNALAAIATARTLEIPLDKIRQSLEEFKGAWRRWQSLGMCGQAEVIADYAHTPDAVAKVIKAAKDFYPNKKIMTVFQPHQYARTKNLFSDFIKAFDGAEKVLLPDIFYVEGRENPADFDVSSEKLAEEIAARKVEVEASGDLKMTEEKIRLLSDKYDVILILGAGNIYEVAKNLAK